MTVSMNFQIYQPVVIFRQNVSVMSTISVLFGILQGVKQNDGSANVLACRFPV